MIKRYFKINEKNFLTDIFMEHQKDKFDGSEIFFDTVEQPDVLINGLGLFDEFGDPQLYYDDFNNTVSYNDGYLNVAKYKNDKKQKACFMALNMISSTYSAEERLRHLQAFIYGSNVIAFITGKSAEQVSAEMNLLTIAYKTAETLKEFRATVASMDMTPYTGDLTGTAKRDAQKYYRRVLLSTVAARCVDFVMTWEENKLAEIMNCNTPSEVAAIAIDDCPNII